MEKSCTIQDVFERFYLSYEKRNSPPAHHRKTAYHIMNCKTGAFGVNISVCEDCGCISIHNNSCRSRCCPMCQEFPKEKWIDEAEYPGIRVSMSTTFDGVVTPLKIDISTGDAITPREVRYSFKLMLEDRSIDIWAYNLETVLAEKLETIITRTTTNTRMRDFYDIYILEQLHGTTLNPKILHDALLATAHKRGSEKYLNQAEEVFDEVENDSVMQKLWEAYRKKFSYASDLEWDVIMKAIRRLYVLCEKGISL